MEKHPEEMYEVSSVHSDKESVAVDLLAERPEQGSNFLAYVCVPTLILFEPSSSDLHNSC